MAAVIISNSTTQFPFGSQSNQAVGRLISLNTVLLRLGEAIATANTGFTGTDGTQFEVGNTDPANQVVNLFGVQADPANPGKQGQVYAYAMAELASAWDTFWTAAKPYIEQLDNGMVTM